MSILDPQIASQLAAELPSDVFAEVVRAFEADLGRLTGEMRQAALREDAESYRRNAHALAGAAGSIGASALEGLARQAMKAPEAVRDPETLTEIEAALQATLHELRKLTEASLRR